MSRQVVAISSAKGESQFISIPGAEFEMAVILVTPELAKEWLAGNVANRRFRPKLTERYSRDMRFGHWELTPTAIVFDKRGVLIDGQHRLKAIVRAGVPVRLLVCRNANGKSREHLDIGERRTLDDRANIKGHLGTVTGGHVSTLKRMLSGLRGYSGDMVLTPPEELAALEKYWEPVSFAVKHIRSAFPGVANAATRGVIARAWFSVDHKQLEHFCHVLCTGVTQSPRDAIIENLFTVLIKKPASGGPSMRERYSKTERALDAFLRSEQLSHLYGSKFELYPLPGEGE